MNLWFFLFHWYSVTKRSGVWNEAWGISAMCLVYNKFLVSFVYVIAFYPSLKLNKWELVVCLESVFRCVEQIKWHLQVSCSIAAVVTLASFLLWARNCNRCICNNFTCWERYYVMWYGKALVLWLIIGGCTLPTAEHQNHGCVITYVGEMTLLISKFICWGSGND